MSGLLYRIRVALLAHAFAYIPMALWLAYEDHAGITFLIISPLVISLAVIWFGWRSWTALDDVRAMLARRRELLRRARLLDAYQPGAVRPTSLADYVTAVNRAA